MQVVLIALQERFPFGIKPKPQEPRVLWHECVDDAVIALSDLFSAEDVKSALRDYFNTPAYQKAICKKKWYRNLNGEQVELIPQDAKDKAQKRLDDISKQSSVSVLPKIIYK